MPESMLSDETLIRFYPLKRLQEGEEWLLGREETSTFVTLPAVGVEVIDFLQNGKTVGEVKAEIAARYGEVPDMDAFIQAMQDCGFVESIGDRKLTVAQKERRIFWPDLKQQHAALAFSAPALILYGLALFSTLWIWFTRPTLLPHAADYFYHPSVTVTVISLWVIGWTLVAFHEFWHFLGARSVGVKADFSLGTRLNFVVAQTDVTGVWSVPRKDRYIVYLAGMLFDTLLLGIFLSLLVLSDDGYFALPIIAYTLFKALVFIQFWKLAWQFQFFMRTDIYYLVATWFNCKNLAGDTQTLLRSILSKLFSRWPLPRKWKENWSQADLSLIPPHEMKSVRIYLPFYLIGTVIALGRFFFNILPITWGLLVRSILVLLHGRVVDPIAFTDAFIYTLFMAFTGGLWAYLMLRDRWRGRTNSKTPAQPKTVVQG